MAVIQVAQAAQLRNVASTSVSKTAVGAILDMTCCTTLPSALEQMQRVREPAELMQMSNAANCSWRLVGQAERHLGHTVQVELRSAADSGVDCFAPKMGDAILRIARRCLARASAAPAECAVARPRGAVDAGSCDASGVAQQCEQPMALHRRGPTLRRVRVRPPSVSANSPCVGADLRAA